jgi:hypothetical protein
MKITSLYIFLAISLLSLSCDDEPEIKGEGQLTIEFDNHVGDDDLVLGTAYVNSSNETFTLSKLNYFISNIKLRTQDNQEFIVPQDSSYFLVMEDDQESQEVIIKNIPAGDYNQITFTVGVDSLRSTMDITKRQGVLDPAQGHDGMYWTWNSGYIFFKMEGTSPAAPADADHKFYYHIGGYGGYETPALNNLREATIDMGNSIAQVRSNKAPEVHLHVDVQEIFYNPETISIAQHPLVMFAEYSKTVSANYVNMFTFDHVHN